MHTVIGRSKHGLDLDQAEAANLYRRRFLVNANAARARRLPWLYARCLQGPRVRDGAALNTASEPKHHLLP
jgi:hypothetical protein